MDIWLVAEEVVPKRLVEALLAEVVEQAAVGPVETVTVVARLVLLIQDLVPEVVPEDNRVLKREVLEDLVCW
jgi:hypothetical protein